MDLDSILLESRDSTLAFAGSRSYVIRLVPEKHCWVGLPRPLAQALHQQSSGLPITIQLTPEVAAPGTGPSARAPPPSCYLAWGGGSAQDDKCVEVPAALAACLRLSGGQQVRLRVLPPDPVADWVEIGPQTPDDWEVLELNAEALEGALLSQVGLLAMAQPVCVWAGQACIRLTATACWPKGIVARLGPGTELRVAPKPRNFGTDTTAQQGAAAAAGVGAAAGPRPSPTLPPLTLRALVMPRQLLVPVPCTGVEPPSAPSAAGSTPTPLTWPTAVALCHPSTLELAGCRPMQAAHLSSPLRIDRRRAADFLAPGVIFQAPIAVLLVGSSCCPVGHVLLAPPLLQLLGVAPHRRITLQPLPAPGAPYPTAARTTRPGTAGTNLGHEPLPLVLPDQVPAAAPGQEGDAPAGTPSQAQTPSLDACAEAMKGVQSDLHAWWDAQRSVLRALVAAESGAKAVSDHAGIDVPTLLAGLPAIMHVHCPQHEPPRVRDACFLLLPPSRPVAGANGSASKPRTLPPGVYMGLLPSTQLVYPTQASGGARQEEDSLHGPCSTACVAHMPRDDFSAWSSDPSLASLDAAMRQVASLDGKAVQAALRHIGMAGAQGAHLLITGPAGSGKQRLLAAVGSMAACLPTGPWHVVHVKCRQLRAEASTEVVLRVLHQALEEAVSTAPSLVLLHALDQVATTTQDGPGPELSFSREEAARVTHLLVSAMKELASAHDGRLDAVRLVATCRSAPDIPLPLRLAGLFDMEVQLAAPSSRGRHEVLTAEAAQREGLTLPHEVAHKLAMLTEGYGPGELRALVDRAAHVVALKAAGGCVEVPPGALALPDVDKILSGYKPPAFWGLAAPQAAAQKLKGWEDVGGLVTAKRLLEDALMLPLKYADLASTSPLRLRTGLLLYGPPGCGKTHLVQAAAAAAQAEHNVRFLSVKGPELLNKYIGASEAAVRGLFERAAGAAPCILFFDEFDAIAPSRGHDSTGVTDRVVNQLLTELDGVEGLKGVVVLAATSRPDMIDAALLRPGRLDRLVYCGFPDVPERQRILEALSASMPLAGDVDLQYVADRTDGFTGADLGAVLSEAQLAAVHERLNGSGTSGDVKVAQRHILEALCNVRPSVPATERARLEGLYMRFQGSRTDGVGARYTNPGLRATPA